VSDRALAERRTLVVRRPLVRRTGDGARLLRTVRGWVVKRALALGIVLVALCMGQVWLRLQVTRLGYQLSDARQMQLRLEHERRELEIELATLRVPDRIDALARERLGMVPPRPGQVVILR
jgi:cell division protein FtsL